LGDSAARYTNAYTQDSLVPCLFGCASGNLPPEN
jgi:hypothetical protein